MQTDPLAFEKPRLTDEPIEQQTRKLTEGAKTRRRIWQVAWAGAVPFIIFALALLFLASDNPLSLVAVDALKTWCAVVLSFLGGIRWGLAMKEDPELARSQFLASIVAPAVAWLSLFLPVPYVFGVLALAIAGQGAWDSFAGQRGVFGLWFVKLRMVFTFIAVATLVVGFFATV